MLLTKGSWDEVRDRLVRTLYKLDLTRPDEMEKLNKGITELSNILTG